MPVAHSSHARLRARLQPAPPKPEDETTDLHFDWDRAIPLSIRTRATLRLMLRAIDEYGTTGQPIWPILAASAHGHHLAGSPPGALPPVASALVHATPLGWGLSIRLTRDSVPLFLTGPWTPARALLSTGWTAQPAFTEDDCPTEPRHQLALAALMGLTAFNRLTPTGPAALLLRIPDAQVARALQHGSSPDAVLQDITMLLTTCCMELHIPRPWTLAAPPLSPIPHLPVAALCTACADSAASQLRLLVRELANRAGLNITIDLFASTTNAQCARFYSHHPEPASAGVDALTQDSWATSLCPWCQALRPEFCLLFPPFPLLRASLLKARADQAHGIAIVPNSHTAPWWPTLMAASKTRPGSKAPYIRVYAHKHVHQCTSAEGARLVLLHFDFWRGHTPRPRACPHGHLPRCSQLSFAATDAADHTQIRLLLEHLRPTQSGNDPYGP